MLNLKEAADKIGVSYATIKAYRKAGRIKGVRVGRNILVREDELERMVLGTDGEDA